ncbi:DUF6503 family protein [Algoriphagus halophilus]|uniref:Uncharacterized protein n=1 Tax=Algoriphagus halophilus TaxID=226505 RepID=A0A1N6E2P0_9BACT|nr:DUF6503 family protein [Algoriphagus halophilus]SIN77251.1 hypothetical protein SAMN05444394_1650 [Algoriphagus halophilus]
MNNLVKSLFFISLVTLTFSCEQEAPTTGVELVQRAISYHDPNGNWDDLKATFYMKDSLPPGRDSRTYEFSLDNSHSKMTYAIEGLQYQVINDSLKILTGGITEERALRMRNYYTYLWGLPMKLNDPGTVIEKEIRKEEIDGKEYLVARVPYEEDQWYFYFEPETYRMAAYKFYKDEPNQVGEIIYLEGEKEFKGIKIPANRTWYRTEKPEFLGVDMLQEIK